MNEVSSVASCDALKLALVDRAYIQKGELARLSLKR